MAHRTWQPFAFFRRDCRPLHTHIPANTVFEDRIQQVDLRFARIFRIGKVRIEGNFDVYNLFASPILSMITRFGPEWLNAQEILAGRLVRFGAQINF